MKNLKSFGLLEIAGLVAGALVLNKFLKGHFGYYASNTNSGTGSGTSATTALVANTVVPSPIQSVVDSLTKSGSSYDSVTAPLSSGYIGTVQSSNGQTFPVVKTQAPVAQSPVSTGNDVVGGGQVSSQFTGDYFG